MNSTDVIAYIGAAAWLQPVIKLIYNFSSKPIITITPDKEFEVGHTAYGPIFNLRLSINVNKDTLVDFIGVEIQHKNGSKHNFEWSGMTEFFSEIRKNNGETQIVQRDIIPISLKLSALSLVERFFRFQDANFIKLNKEKIEKLVDIKKHMEQKDENYPGSFLNSKHFLDYLEFTRESFYWQAGQYTVKFNVRSPVKFKLKEIDFNFELTQGDIDKLRENLEAVKTFFAANITKKSPNDMQDGFNWLRRALNKIG